MTFFSAPKTPAGRCVMNYLNKLEKRSSNRKQRVGCMSKRNETKDHTITRLRGQRDILRRVAQARIDEVQENDDKRNEELVHSNVVQESVDDEREELLSSALRRIQKLEKRLDRVCAELEGEKNKNRYMQAQLQSMHEARAEDGEIVLCSVFMDEACFTMSPNEDTYACAVARQKALAVQVTTRFGNDSATAAKTEGLQGINRRKSLPSEEEDQGTFHFIRGVFGARALTV